jgi:hypothetical protein
MTAQGRSQTAIALVIACALAVLGGCETTTAGGAVGADRSQLILVSYTQLDQMAAQSYAKLAADASRKGALNQDHAMLARVELPRAPRPDMR